MTIEGGGASSAGLIARVKGILLTPKTEWEVIDNEPATINSLYVGYAVILAAIPAIATFIGSSLIGASAFGVTVKPPIAAGLITAIVSYVLSLVSVGLLGFIINALAPSFDGTKDTVKAFKVAIYASTAGWVAGIFSIIPMLGILAILGMLYGCYLIYLGLPRLMNAPETKALGYTVVTIVVAIVLNILVGIVAFAVSAPFIGAATMMGGGSTVSGNLKVPGVGSVNVGELERAAKQMEQQMTVASEGGNVTINTGASTAPDALQSLLPAALPGGYARTETSSGGMSGVASGAEGVYQRGDSRIEVNIVDAGAMGALAGAVNINSSRTTATGYEKVSSVGGRMITEEFDRSDSSGKYGVMVGKRFMVEAEGNKVTMGDLKAAVESVPFARLEAMAKG